MDTVSLKISIFAILISGGTFYLQYVYRNDSVVCTLVGYDAQIERAAVNIAISNVGSRAILLRDARLSVEFNATSGHKVFYDRIDNHNLNGPVLIGKGEIVNAALSLPLGIDNLKLFESWKEDGRIESESGICPFWANLVFVSGSGKIIKSKELVLSARYDWERTEVIPRKQISWRVGSKTIEDFEII